MVFFIVAYTDGFAFLLYICSYIVEFNCTSDFGSRKISDAQKSFPSGHTSLSAFVALFMMVCVALQRIQFDALLL